MVRGIGVQQCMSYGTVGFSACWKGGERSVKPSHSVIKIEKKKEPKAPSVVGRRTKKEKTQPKGVEWDAGLSLHTSSEWLCSLFPGKYRLHPDGIDMIAITELATGGVFSSAQLLGLHLFTSSSSSVQMYLRNQKEKIIEMIPACATFNVFLRKYAWNEYNQ